MSSYLALAVLAGGPTTFDLRFRPAPGKPIVFNAVEDRVEGGASTSLGTRFELLARANSGVDLLTGPFTSQGRTFGRPKTRFLGMTPQATLMGDGLGRPPFLLSVPLPSHPVKVGDAWTAAIVGPTPMPAGVKATFRALGPARVGGAPCLKIAVKIDTELGGARITGGGESAVRLADGLVQTGALNVLLVYRRPDPNTRKMVENARVTVKARIARGN